MSNLLAALRGYRLIAGSVLVTLTLASVLFARADAEPLPDPTPPTAPSSESSQAPAPDSEPSSDPTADPAPEPVPVDPLPDPVPPDNSFDPEQFAIVEFALGALLMLVAIHVVGSFRHGRRL